MSNYLDFLDYQTCVWEKVKQNYHAYFIAIQLPLPLPPAWTWALRMRPPVGSNGMETFLASSGVRAIEPF